MSDENALFVVISERDLYEKLELLAPGLFPAQTFAFLGSTFSDADWKPGQKGHLLPTSRLLWRWVFMNERTSNDYLPVIRSGRFKMVVVHEYGREAYLYAIRHRNCEETYSFHKSLVRERIMEQGASPPHTYIARRPTDPRLITADELYFGEPDNSDDPKQKMYYLQEDTLGEQLQETFSLFADMLNMPRPLLNKVAA